MELHLKRTGDLVVEPASLSFPEDVFDRFFSQRRRSRGPRTLRTDPRTYLEDPDAHLEASIAAGELTEADVGAFLDDFFERELALHEVPGAGVVVVRDGLVLAAGLGNIELAGMLGKTIPLNPEKGQLLVTERVAPFLPFPMSGIRQTANGSVMIGYTNEDTGFEVSTTTGGSVARSVPVSGIEIWKSDRNSSRKASNSG